MKDTEKPTAKTANARRQKRLRNATAIFVGIQTSSIGPFRALTEKPLSAEPQAEPRCKTRQSWTGHYSYDEGVAVPVSVDDPYSHNDLRCAQCFTGAVEEQPLVGGAVFRWFQCHRCGHIWYVPHSTRAPQAEGG